MDRPQRKEKPEPSENRGSEERLRESARETKWQVNKGSPCGDSKPRCSTPKVGSSSSETTRIEKSERRETQEHRVSERKSCHHRKQHHRVSESGEISQRYHRREVHDSEHHRHKRHEGGCRKCHCSKQSQRHRSERERVHRSTGGDPIGDVFNSIGSFFSGETHSERPRRRNCHSHRDTSYRSCHEGRREARHCGTRAHTSKMHSSERSSERSERSERIGQKSERYRDKSKCAEKSERVERSERSEKSERRTEKISKSENKEVKVKVEQTEKAPVYKTKPTDEICKTTSDKPKRCDDKVKVEQTEKAPVYKTKPTDEICKTTGDKPKRCDKDSTLPTVDLTNLHRVDSSRQESRQESVERNSQTNYPDKELAEALEKYVIPSNAISMVAQEAKLKMENPDAYRERLKLEIGRQLKEGIIKPEDLNSPVPPEGAMLVAAGALKPEELKAAVDIQMQLKSQGQDVTLRAVLAKQFENDQTRMSQLQKCSNFYDTMQKMATQNGRSEERQQTEQKDASSEAQRPGTDKIKAEEAQAALIKQLEKYVPTTEQIASAAKQVNLSFDSPNKIQELQENIVKYTINQIQTGKMSPDELNRPLPSPEVMLVATGALTPAEIETARQTQAKDKADGKEVKQLGQIIMEQTKDNRDKQESIGTSLRFYQALLQIKEKEAKNATPQGTPKDNPRTAPQDIMPKQDKSSDLRPGPGGVTKDSTVPEQARFAPRAPGDTQIKR